MNILLAPNSGDSNLGLYFFGYLCTQYQPSELILCVIEACVLKFALLELTHDNLNPKPHVHDKICVCLVECTQ